MPLFWRKLLFDKVTSCCHFFPRNSASKPSLLFAKKQHRANFRTFELERWTLSTASGSSERRKRKRREPEYLMWFINIYMMWYSESQRKTKYESHEKFLFYANIIIYLTIWLDFFLRLLFCHSTWEYRLFASRCNTCTQHTYFFSPATPKTEIKKARKKQQPKKHNHTCYFINTHFFVDSWK